MTADEKLIEQNASLLDKLDCKTWYTTLDLKLGQRRSYALRVKISVIADAETPEAQCPIVFVVVNCQTGVEVCESAQLVGAIAEYNKLVTADARHS